MQRIVGPTLYLLQSHGYFCSPTMGGLYFWVCKMKPDAPALGCRVPTDLTPPKRRPILKKEFIMHDLYNRNGAYRNIWEFEGRIVATNLRDRVHSDPVISSVALYIASLIEIGQQTTLTKLEITGIGWVVNLASGIIDTVGTKAISRMSPFNVWWTVGGTPVLVITLLVKAPELFTLNNNFANFRKPRAEYCEFCVCRLRKVRRLPCLRTIID